MIIVGSRWLEGLAVWPGRSPGRCWAANTARSSSPGECQLHSRYRAGRRACRSAPKAGANGPRPEASAEARWSPQTVPAARWGLDSEEERCWQRSAGR